jgi:hypothetical protein
LTVQSCARQLNILTKQTTFLIEGSVFLPQYFVIFSLETKKKLNEEFVSLNHLNLLWDVKYCFVSYLLRVVTKLVIKLKYCYVPNQNSSSRFPNPSSYSFQTLKKFVEPLTLLTKQYLTSHNKLRWFSDTNSSFNLHSRNIFWL